MRKNIVYLFCGLFLFAGLLASSAWADLGLAQTLSDQGLQAVGAAVKTAAEAIYAGTDDPVEIKSQLIALLNEAEATGDEDAMRYAIVAVMMAGGEENLDLSKEAINNSNLFANHPELTAFTVASTAKLIGGGAGSAGGAGSGQAGGGEKQQGGGEKQQGGGEKETLGGGEEDPTSLGGGDPDPFDLGSAVTPYGKIDDQDSAATRT